MLVLQKIELKVLECLVLKSWLALIWSRVFNKPGKKDSCSRTVWKSMIQQDSGVCYRHRSASEVFNVAYRFALHMFQLCNQKLCSGVPNLASIFQEWPTQCSSICKKSNFFQSISYKTCLIIMRPSTLRALLVA